MKIDLFKNYSYSIGPCVQIDLFKNYSYSIGPGVKIDRLAKQKYLNEQLLKNVNMNVQYMLISNFETGCHAIKINQSIK